MHDKIVHAYVKIENINLCSNIKIRFWQYKGGL